ncbi:MAG: ATP-binding protein, partial [Starkeya sp.]|nr:ATP-binding protein [Starkeya sp.]
LLDNAIKYSAPETPGERRELDLRATRIGDRLRLVVADRGPGIPEADRPRVLERFVRLEASRTRPGFGLGLSLVAAVVRLHGGTLSLEGNDPGLRVVIDLPLDLSDEAEAA